jgi:hypothetical protein
VVIDVANEQSITALLGKISVIQRTLDHLHVTKFELLDGAANFLEPVRVDVCAINRAAWPSLRRNLDSQLTGASTDIRHNRTLP